MENKSLIKTIIICITAIICISIAGYVYYQSNRYFIDGNGSVIDKYKEQTQSSNRVNYNIND